MGDDVRIGRQIKIERNPFYIPLLILYIVDFLLFFIHADIIHQERNTDNQNRSVLTKMQNTRMILE